MKIKDQARWQGWVDANTDPYGKSCVDFARDWAELMEAGMQTLSITPENYINDHAKDDSRVADQRYHITGFMYGAAVAMLAECWEYGEALRVWHNIETQIGNEGEKANEDGGVLNPALVSFSTKEDG